MPQKYIAFFVFLYVCGTILGLIIDNETVGSNEQSTLNTLMSWQNVGSEESWGILQLLNFSVGYFRALWDTLTWNFSFFTGGWIYLKWIIWTPLMAMAVWGIVLTLISIVQKVLS